MKKKIIILIGMGLLTTIVALPVMAENSTHLFFENWGGNLKQYATSTQKMKDSDIYARGKRAIVLEKDIQQATDFYILTGMDEISAKSEAERYMLEREAMYQKAISEGYSVSDQDVYEYINELKQTINQADNKSEVYSVINQFDSEEAYWEYELSVYRKNLPIQNYVADLEKKYYQHASLIRGTQAAEEGWASYFEEFKRSLSDNENYKIK